MSWYVFALVDRLPPGRPGRGLTGPIGVRRHGDAFAVVERRVDVPPADFGTLRKHQAVVNRLAGRVPAILPVRFGTLLEAGEIDEALADRDEEIAQAFALVRNRVQFTWRRKVPPPRTKVHSTRVVAAYIAPPIGPGSDPGAGAAYLRRAARSIHPPPPAAFSLLRRKLRPLVAHEQFQPATEVLPQTLYHLVPRASVRRYAAAASILAAASPVLHVSGPWAPFAFTPDLL